MVTVGHFSDLHGDLRALHDNEVVPDVWAWTGDMLREDWYRPRGHQPAIQRAWLKKHKQDFKSYFRGKPVLLIGGNHDWIDPVPILLSAGIDVRQVTTKKQEILGITYAGFRNITWVDNTMHDCDGLAVRWMGESTPAELQVVVDEVFADPPDLLLTHSPPHGVMDNGRFGGNFGIPALATALSYREHAIKVHAFGHIHERGGLAEAASIGVLFSNAATRLQFFEVKP